MSEFKATAEQSLAIKHRGDALLVSAAAGSGKTKVLVERLLSFVTETDFDVDDFLIITYTRAAASELREKIRAEIYKRLAAEPSNRKLRRQALLCAHANISTIHSFCTDLMRENAHALALSPDFRVADENECEIIKNSVLEDVLEQAYESVNENTGFESLCKALSAGRDDRSLCEIILDTHTKLQSHPYPDLWVARQVEAMSVRGVCDVSETVWGSLIMDSAKNTAVYWHREMSTAYEEMQTLPELNNKYGRSVAVTIAGIESFIAALDESWDKARRYSRVEFPRAAAVSGYDEFKALRKRCKSAFEKISQDFECASAELLEDLQAVFPALNALMQIVLTFDDAYTQEKRRLGIVDFSDEEHLALSLLINRETGEKTHAAHTVAGRFCEIMVDEYQDVNAVQELIFKAISDGTNIFMVGDVKQSIYRFRLADPSIFLGKYLSFKDIGDEDTAEGTRIMLSANFRSRAGILNAVNFVFSNVMSKQFGEMDYSVRECLVPGREDNSEPHDLGPAVELDVIDTKSREDDEEEDSPGKIVIEARFIAKRIMQIVQSGAEIQDGEIMRPVDYGDFAILLRSVKKKAGIYAEVLNSMGIPSGKPDDGGFFDTFEIVVALSMLMVIDNPYQDIPLISVMRSPVFGFTADELAQIRASSQDTDFYTALKTSAQTNQKSREFLTQLDAYRLIAPDMTADRLIWRIYNDTGMIGLFGAMKGGAKRRENLLKLINLAENAGQNGYKGLFAFVSHIKRLLERGADLSFDSGEEQNGVKIMSIHKSKGLEFPIVILADLSKLLNSQDASKPLLVHSTLGVGAIRLEHERRIQYTTLSRRAISKKLTQEMMAEELRVLYVGMTRAREKLIMTASYKNAERELSKLSALKSERLDPEVLRNTRNMAGWVLLPALRRPESSVLFGGEAPQLRHGDWDIRLVRGGETDSRSTVVTEHEEIPAAEPDDIETIRERLEYTYPYTQAQIMPSKLTVTEIKGRLDDDPEIVTQERIKHRLFDRPEFITRTRTLTASERGTALHTVMQFIDFTKCTSESGIESEIARLAENRFISRAQAGAVEVLKLYTFFTSEFGRRILESEEVRREFKFSVLDPASNYHAQGGTEKILLQGIIDCFFKENGKLVIADFKTDRVTDSALRSKVEQYRVQLDTYARVLADITGLEIKERILYFFALDRAVTI